MFRLGTFEGTAGPGQVNLIRFIFISGLPSQETRTVDFGAITSGQTTGLTSISTRLTNLQNVTQSATRDLNSRLFRARAGVNRPRPSTVSTLDGDNSRHLDFAANQGIDSRVALGLADEVEVPANAEVSGAERTGATITVPIGGSAKAPLDGKIVINDEAPSRFEVFTEFDFGFYDQDDLSTVARGFDSDTFGSTLGAEYRIPDNLHAGVALTHQTSDADITGGLGSSDLEGQIFSTYFTTFRGDSFVDFLYSYGDFENEVTRNTLLGSFARGDTESDSHNLSLNGGTLLHRTESFSFGPTAGFDYATGTIDGDTETGGGAANLVVPDHDFESAVTRLGAGANFYYDTKAGNVTSQLRAAWAHEFSPENGVVTAAQQTSPFALNGTPTGGFTASQNRGRVGTDWLEIGATTRIEFDDSPLHLELGYQGMIGRDRAVGHFGSVRLGYDW